MWSPQQEKALSEVQRWFDQGKQPVFKLFGYAGTGKTTLAKHFAEGIPGRVAFAAYTGKAAHVLQEKGCPATTIHSLIYSPKNKSEKRLKELEIAYGQTSIPEDKLKLKQQIIQEQENLKRPMFVLNPDSALIGCSLLIVDECSMVDEQMGGRPINLQCTNLGAGRSCPVTPSSRHRFLYT